MDLELVKTVIFLLIGGFLIFLAITVTRDNFVHRLNRLVGALLFLAGLGPIFMGLGGLIQHYPSGTEQFSDTAAYQLHIVWTFVFPVLLVFSWVYPTDRLREFRYQWLRYLVFLPQFMHLVVVVFFGDINSLLSGLEAGTGTEGLLSVVLKPFTYVLSLILLFISYIRANQLLIFGSINLLYIVIAYYFLETGERYLTNPRLLAQSRMVLWAVRLGLGLYVIYVLWKILLPAHFPSAIQTLLLLIAPLVGAVILAYAIIRHQFLDVRMVFRQSLIYTFTSAMLVGGYILLVTQSRRFLTPVFGEQAEIVSYLFIVFILLMFQPISNWIDNIIRSMFLRTRTDYRNIIERFSRQIISMFDPPELRRTIEETLKTALLVERVYFVLYDDRQGEYVLLPGEQNPKRRIVQRDDLMLRGINLLDSPTTMESLSDYEERSDLAGLLRDFHIQMIVPMKDAEHLLGFLALTSKVAGYRYTAEDFNLLGVLSNQMVSALTNARLYVESLERMRLQEEVNMARQIQLNLLPTTPPTLDLYAISAQSTPSRTVGGDFYDFVPISGKDRMGIVIADASGKGMPAALMIAQIQAIIRSEIHNGNAISTMLKNMNQQVTQSTSAEAYVTLFYGELDINNGLFYYANAGHNHPILARDDGSYEALEIGGPIIGAFPFMEYTSASVQLRPNDVIFFFTDGLSEAMNTDGVEYGEDRIRDFILGCRDKEPAEIMKLILDDVYAYDPTTPPRDDTTIIAMKMLPKGVTIGDTQA
ncbi:MAG: SpoIIE family protein phosphatase [Candidatus Zixiibacteriota bacterium]|jgi:sigma-B regulation protein RsbU (phosphoserine phosphatase)